MSWGVLGCLGMSWGNQTDRSDMGLSVKMTQLSFKTTVTALLDMVLYGKKVG